MDSKKLKFKILTKEYPYQLCTFIDPVKDSVSSVSHLQPRKTMMVIVVITLSSIWILTQQLVKVIHLYGLFGPVTTTSHFPF